MALVLGAVACSGDTATDPTPTPLATEPSAPNVDPSLIGLPLLDGVPLIGNLTPTLNDLLRLGYLRCTPQPEARAQARIGVAGGTIRAGKHTLTIPSGALSQTVTITMRAPSDSTVSVVFAPEGLTFNQRRAPTLTLDYSSCSGSTLLNLKKRIVYADNLLNILEILSSLDDLGSRKVSAPIKHFSRYAVHY
ncbi:MAG TPA: hypothetical protein VFS33_05690 [Gemmatimonadales bacterium]|nr:hypothetical protein [Gemmatimonadales bacterium]